MCSVETLWCTELVDVLVYPHAPQPQDRPGFQAVVWSPWTQSRVREEQVSPQASTKE